MVMFKEGQRNPNFGILLENLIVAEKWGEIWRGTHDEFGKVLIVAYKRDPGRAMFDRALPHLKKWSRLAEGGQRGLLRLHKIYSTGKVPILIVENPGLKTVREHFSTETKNLKAAARFAHACSKILVKAEEAGLPSIGFTPDSILYNPERRATPCNFIPVCPGALGMEVQLGEGRYFPSNAESDSAPLRMGLDVYALGWIWTEILRGFQKIDIDPYSMDQYVKREDLRKVIQKLQEHSGGNFCRASEAESLIATWWKSAKDEQRSQASPADPGPKIESNAPQPPPIPGSKKKKSPPALPPSKSSANARAAAPPDDDDDFFGSKSKPKRKFPILPIAAGVLGLVGLAIGAMFLIGSLGGSGSGSGGSDYDLARDRPATDSTRDPTPDDAPIGAPDSLPPEQTPGSYAADPSMDGESGTETPGNLADREEGGSGEVRSAPEPTGRVRSAPPVVDTGPESIDAFIAAYRTVNEGRDWGALLNLFHFEGTPQEIQPKLAARASAFSSDSFDTDFEANDNFEARKTETINGVEYEPNLRVIGKLKVTSAASKTEIPVGITGGIYKIAGLTKAGDGPASEPMIEVIEEEDRGRSSGPVELADDESAAEFELGNDLIVSSNLTQEEIVGSWVVNPRAEFSNPSGEAVHFRYHLAIFDADRNLIGCDSAGAKVEADASGPIAGIMIEAPGASLDEVATYEAVLYESNAPIASADFASAVASSALGADEAAAMVVTIGDAIKAEARVFAETREGETVIRVPSEIHNTSDRSALVTYHIALFDNYGELLGGASDNGMVDPGQYLPIGQPEIRLPPEALARVQAYQIVLYDGEQELGRRTGRVEKGKREIAAVPEPTPEDTPEKEAESDLGSDLKSDAEPESDSDGEKSEDEKFLDDLFSSEPDAPYIPPGREVASAAGAGTTNAGSTPDEETAPVEFASFNSGDTVVDEDDPLAVKLGWGKHAGVNEDPYSYSYFQASASAAALGYLGSSGAGGGAFGSGAVGNPGGGSLDLFDEDYSGEDLETGIMIFVVVFMTIFFYIFPAVCFHQILRKTDSDYVFAAWLPGFNITIVPLIVSGRPWYWYFLMNIPWVGLFFFFVIYWDMCIQREKSGFWAFAVILCPPIGLTYIAFSE